METFAVVIGAVAVIAAAWAQLARPVRLRREGRWLEEVLEHRRIAAARDAKATEYRVVRDHPTRAPFVIIPRKPWPSCSRRQWRALRQVFYTRERRERGELRRAGVMAVNFTWGGPGREVAK